MSESRFGTDARVWGLTGGIASGKSTAARFFVESGVPVLDADAVAAELRVKGGAAYEAIVERFGTAEREKLREIVFADPGARRELEAILHPLIQAESDRRITRMVEQRRATGESPVLIIYEAALLVETGRYRQFDGLILVTASEEARVKRLSESREMSEAGALKIVRSQMPESDKRAVADYVIENNGSLEELRRSVEEIKQSLLRPPEA